MEEWVPYRAGRPEEKLIEVALTKCRLCFTERELIRLLARDPALWKKALARGKASRRAEKAARRGPPPPIARKP